MTFYLSKILWYLFNPFNLIILLILLSIFLKFVFRIKFFTRITFIITLFYFILVGVFPSGDYLIYKLENKFHSSNIFPEKVDGILILSGATNPKLTKEYNQISLNDSVERLHESFYLIKKYPDAKIIFSGGSGSISKKKLTHSEVAKKFFLNFDIHSEKIIFENKSRNTFENILYSKEIAKPNNDQKWIIVTSAYHMTRSLNVADKLEWKLIPYAVDFKLLKNFYWRPSMDFFNNLSAFQFASHEWVGLFYYYFLGRSSKVF